MTWVHVEFERVEQVTPKAICFIIDGVRQWIPKSQIAPADVDGYDYGDTDGSVSVTDWIAREKGLA